MSETPVCFFVSVVAYLKNRTPKFHHFLYIIPEAVTRAASDGIAQKVT